MVGSFYRFMEYLTSSALLYLYKSQIRPKMEYCCHIWADVAKTTLSIMDRVQRRLRLLVGVDLYGKIQPRSLRTWRCKSCLVLSLLSWPVFWRTPPYFPPLNTVERTTHSSLTILVNHPHYNIITPRVNRNAHLVLSPDLWNSLPLECFPEGCDLDAFKKRVNIYLPHRSILSRNP